jgi:hypothetical protein
MSGGTFDYNQRLIADIAEEIDALIEKNGAKKTKEELKDEFWKDSDWYTRYPEDLYHHKYPDEVMEEFKNAAKYLRIAYIYAQRIDWLISGDDVEETFLKRLEQDLNKLKTK